MGLKESFALRVPAGNVGRSSSSRDVLPGSGQQHSAVCRVGIVEVEQSQSQSSSTSAVSMQEEAAAASVTKPENNWVDTEIRLLIDLWGDDQIQSDLRASREIHDHHRVANWRHFCCAMQVNR